MQLLGLAPGYDPFERPPGGDPAAANGSSGGGGGGGNGNGAAAARRRGKRLGPEAEARLRAQAIPGDSIQGFLGKALDAPHALSVTNAIDLLVQIGALTPQGGWVTRWRAIGSHRVSQGLGIHCTAVHSFTQ